MSLYQIVAVILPVLHDARVSGILSLRAGTARLQLLITARKQIMV